MKATLVPGSTGQFDVVVDGQTIASKKGGLFRRLLKSGWPDPDAVVAEIARRRSKTG